jgi:hypothetical protein
LGIIKAKLEEKIPFGYKIAKLNLPDLKVNRRRDIEEANFAIS